MFVRKKKNKSGVISVQVINKSNGKYQLEKTIGSSANLMDVERLCKEGELYIKTAKSQLELDYLLGSDDYFLKKLNDSILNLELLGPNIILGKIFLEIGYGKIMNPLFKLLVIGRLIYPSSKLKTVDYISKYNGLQISVSSVYRFLKSIDDKQIKNLQQISYKHTMKILNNVLHVVLYDVTNVYFESFTEDDFKKAGFNKDGKHGQPQIVIGLLVSQEGYPLDYAVFDGKKFEGHTMMPIIEGFKEKYAVQNLIIVADAGLMSNKNIKEIIASNNEFIIGGRIKNETATVQEKILALKLNDGQIAELLKDKEQRLVVSYSQSRAKNDDYNRTKGYEKLKEKVKAGKLTKEHINNKGYNKYLKLDGETKVSIDDAKYKDDAKWDGLKGYVTNTGLTKEEVIENYTQLWVVEKAFRVAKSELMIRPIYHFKKQTILAHIAIIFASYKLYKEFERQLKLKKSSKSVDQAIEILKTIFGLKLQLPNSKEIKMVIINKTEEQNYILGLF